MYSILKIYFRVSFRLRSAREPLPIAFERAEIENENLESIEKPIQTYTDQYIWMRLWSIPFVRSTSNKNRK